MAFRALEKPGWKAYFDYRSQKPERAEIEIAGLESMKVNDSEGRRQIVKLMIPLRYIRRVVAP
jgi:hypothetical protein